LPFIVYNTPLRIVITYREDCVNRAVSITNVCGFDRQTRYLYVPHEATIPELENGTPVGSVYEVWASQREDTGSLPTINNLPDAFCMTRRSLDVFIVHRFFAKLSICRKHDTKLVRTFQYPFNCGCLEQEIQRCDHDGEPRYNHNFENVSGVSHRFTPVHTAFAATRGIGRQYQ
jgi:hypothetical protein